MRCTSTSARGVLAIPRQRCARAASLGEWPAAPCARPCRRSAAVVRAAATTAPADVRLPRWEDIHRHMLRVFACAAPQHPTLLSFMTLPGELQGPDNQRRPAVGGPRARRRADGGTGLCAHPALRLHLCYAYMLSTHDRGILLEAHVKAVCSLWQVLVDVRPAANFEKAHPAGAVNVQLFQRVNFRSGFPELAELQ